MARIFITGSSDGLGLLAAKSLIKSGHSVVLHSRNEERAHHTMSKIEGAEKILVGDLSDFESIKELAEQVNLSGNFDAVIHNAGIYQSSFGKMGNNGLSEMLWVNVLAPYILTCLIEKPKRLIYTSSDMHFTGNPELSGFNMVSYSDTKLMDLMLAKIISRKWGNVYSNAVDPGWVPTKMGGANAPDDLDAGYETQVWLATSEDEDALVSGKYFHHKKQSGYLEVSDDINVQEQFLKRCEELTGIKLK